MRIAKTITWLLLAQIALLDIVYPKSASQYYKANLYTKAIRAILNKSPDTSNLNAADLRMLGLAYMTRGYLLKDILALQIDIGRDYYSERDTSRVATSSPYTPYFLGRYLFEKGKYKLALKYFNKCLRLRKLSAAYKNRARIWAGACHFRLGNKQRAKTQWAAVPTKNNALLKAELLYARWLLKENVTINVKLSGEKSEQHNRWKLWKAAHDGIIAELPALQRDLIDSPAPDVTYKVDKKFSLRFYDPASIHILAYADFIAAMHAFNGIKNPGWQAQIHQMAGICAFEAGEYARARRFLKQSKKAGNLNNIYLGALDYISGNRNQAEAKWRKVINSKKDKTILTWAMKVSRFRAKKENVMDVCSKYVELYKITEKALAKLYDEKIPEEIPDRALRKLEQHKGRVFYGTDEYLTFLRTTIGQKQTNKFKLNILRHTKYNISPYKLGKALLQIRDRKSVV